MFRSLILSPAVASMHLERLVAEFEQPLLYMLGNKFEGQDDDNPIIELSPDGEIFTDPELLREVLLLPAAIVVAADASPDEVRAASILAETYGAKKFILDPDTGGLLPMIS